MRLAHFTNANTRWGDKAPWQSTGFVERITTEGFRSFSNFGLANTEAELKASIEAFKHHGLRCNKKRVNGNRSQCALIIVEGDFAWQPGNDHPLHVQVNQPIPPSCIVSIAIIQP